MVAENLSHNSETISPNSDSNMSDVLEFDPDAAAQRIEEEKRRIQNEINPGWKSNAAMVDKMPSQENLDNKDFEKLTEICLETQTVFLDSVACFGNATHLLYRQITGKESPRTPDSDGRIKDEFKIPMSSARAVSQNLPEGYSILDSDEARRMLTENDLLLETPLGGQISIYGDLIDNPMEGRDFQKISILDNNGIEREVRVETLGQNIEHTIFHIVYESDLFRVASDKLRNEFQAKKMANEASLMLEMVNTAPGQVNIDPNGDFNDFRTILEMMVFNGDGSLQLKAPEQGRVLEKIRGHFKAKTELARRKSDIIAQFGRLYSNSEQGLSPELSYVLSGFEDVISDARATSTNVNDFLTNFIVESAKRYPEINFNQILSERLKTLPNFASGDITGEEILTISNTNRVL